MGYKIYMVGGAVRDELLNRPVTDRDWVIVGATVEQLLAKNFLQVGKDFPVFLHPETKEEYALARTEKKSGHGYTGFEVVASSTVTLEEDLMRRDLTINAIAKDELGNYYDPYNGQQDIDNRVLRHVSNAFIEDPLRILRLARFYARFYEDGFTIAKETQKLVNIMIEVHELDHLVAERIWLETQKALKENNPDQYFITLHNLGALKIIFPSLEYYYDHVYESELTTMFALIREASLNNLDMRLRVALLLSIFDDIELVKAFSQTYRLSIQEKESSEKLLRFKNWLLEADLANPESYLTLLLGLDAFRRPELLTDYLVCMRLIAEQQNWLEHFDVYAEKIVGIQEQILKIDIKPIILGLSGKEIPIAIKSARLALIDELINN